MIIIAGAVIISLTETKIIDQAGVAVEKHNISEIQSAANLAYAEYLLTDRTTTLQGYISNKLIKDGVIAEEEKGKYYINEDLTVEEVDQDAFIYVVDIPEDNYNWTFNSNTISDGDFFIDWDDDTYSDQDNLVAFEHTYANKGIYEIKIKGDFYSLETTSSNSEDIEMVIAIKSFGNLGLEELYLDIGSRCKYLPIPNQNSFKNLTNFDVLSLNGLEEIPDYFFYGAPIETVGFLNIKSLKYVPANVFEGCTTLKNVYRIFYGCENLTGFVPPLWDDELYPNITDHREAFTGTNVTRGYDGSEIPADWK